MIQSNKKYFEAITKTGPPATVKRQNIERYCRLKTSYVFVIVVNKFSE
jgi:hypothetical protein